MLNGCVPVMQEHMIHVKWVCPVQHMIHVKWVCPGDAGAHDTH